MAANEENEAGIRLVVEDPSHPEARPDEPLLSSAANARRANLKQHDVRLHLRLEPD